MKKTAALVAVALAAAALVVVRRAGQRADEEARLWAAATDPID